MNRISLLYSYIKVGFRHLLRQKSFTLTNIAGLTVGMTLCLLIVVGFMLELSYDRFHENTDRLYRVTSHLEDEELLLTSAAAPVGPILERDYPEIEKTARFIAIGEQLVQSEDEAVYEKIIVADRALFDICTFPLVAGDEDAVLAGPNTVMIDESTAEKLFGTEDPVGRTLVVAEESEMTVCGVFEDVPKESTFQFDVVLPWAFTAGLEDFREDDWEDYRCVTFALLDAKAGEEAVESKISGLPGGHVAESRVDLALQSFRDIHMNSNPNGPSLFFVIFMFIFIGMFILLISCINFVNLSTARSSTRFKEIGVRKVIGGSKRDIIVQFFGESFIVVAVSFVLSLVLLKVSLDWLHSFTGHDFSMNVLTDPRLLVYMAGILLFTGFAAGCYPALHLSSFMPADVIRGTHRNGRKGQVFRRVLVTTQFTASVIFIIIAIVSARQADYILSYDKGWSSENIIRVPLRGADGDSYEVLKAELLEQPGVEAVTAGYNLPTWYNKTSGVTWPGMDPQMTMNVAFNIVDFDYIETLGIEMAEGRSFSEQNNDGPASYIVNETFARTIGSGSAVGSEMTVWDTPGRIVGVTKDYNYRTLKSGVDPMVLLIRDKSVLRHMIVKLAPGSDESTLAGIGEAWRGIFPNHPFEYAFVDDDIYLQYNDEDAMGKFMKGISVAALLMTCSGLVGLVTFMAERKKKEIGVRKIHGASAVQIVRLISREFMILAGISNLIGWPLAYLMARAYLQSYAVRTDVGAGAFLFAGTATVMIALLTISYRSIRAARANPVEALRSE